MQLKYRLSESEFCQAHRAHIRRSVINFKNAVVLLIAVLMAALQAEVLGGTGFALKIFYGLWIAVAGLVAYAYWFLPARHYRMQPKNSAEQELSLDRDGIEVKQGEDRRYYTWDEIGHRGEDRQFVLIQPKHRVPIAIPKRVLESDEKLNELREILYTLN